MPEPRLTPPRPRSLRVALVCASSVHGGAEIYVQRVAAALTERGHEVVLFGDIPGYVGRSIDPGLGPKWSRRTLLGGLRRLGGERARVREALRAYSPDVIHMQFKREQIGLSGAVADLAPIVWTEHGRLDRRGLPAVLVPAYRRAARRVAAITAVSASVAHDVDRVVGAGRALVITNAADTERFRPPDAAARSAARAAFGIEGCEPTLAWVARMHPTKRPELALRIAEEWSGVVLLAGEGVALAAARARAEWLPNVRVLGHMDDVRGVLAASDALLMTSGRAAREGVPTTTMLEAAAMGVPTVASAEIEGDEAVAATGGTVVPAGADVEDWARALRETVLAVDRSDVARGWAEANGLGPWGDRIERVFVQAGSSTVADGRL